MGHALTALLTAHECDSSRVASWDLPSVALPRLTLFHVTHYYSAYWQARRGYRGMLDVPSHFPAIFPRERVLVDLLADITQNEAPRFALIQTNYFGGIGEQWACFFEGTKRLSAPEASINGVLCEMGVLRGTAVDEFEAVELDRHRHTPDEFYERYVGLCDELGV
jgi:hypothetical protein